MHCICSDLECFFFNIISFKLSLWDLLNLMSHVYYLLGEGGALPARPVSLPHRPGEGVSRSDSGPRGRTDRPVGRLRGGR